MKATLEKQKTKLVPISQYASGTDVNIGGMTMAGTEERITIPAGTKVFTHEETMNILKNVKS